MTSAREDRSFFFELCLGRGGFGEVYLARATTSSGLAQQVAIKMLREGLNVQSEAVKRLRDEAKMQVLVRHPAIVRVHDLTRIGGRVAMVTEYVDGCDLKECMKSQPPLSEKAVAEICATIADALDTAYNSEGPDGEPLRLLHRDIKPSNIRIGKKGSVKLLDFGVARAQMAGREAETQTDQVFGSFPYMPPERFAGDNKHANSDVYSLGTVVFALLTGRYFMRKMPIQELFRLALTEEDFQAYRAKRLEMLPNSGGTKLEKLVIRCLEYDPNIRPSCGELAEALEEVAADAQGPSLRRWCRDRDWGEVADQGGMLVGSTYTESRFLSPGLTTLTDMEAPPKGLASHIEMPDPNETVESSTPPPVVNTQTISHPYTPTSAKRNRLAVGIIAISFVAALAGLGLAAVVVSYPWTSDDGAESAPEAETTQADEIVVSPETADTDAKGAVALDTPAKQVKTPRSRPESTPTEPPSDGGEQVTATSSAPCGVAYTELADTTLTEAQLACAETQMRNPDLKVVSRDAHGRAVLRVEWERCEQRGQCSNFESTQSYFFKEIGQYDPDMTLRWASYLYGQGINDRARADAVLKWTGRALQEKRQWKGSKFVQNMDLTHELRARTANKRWVLAEKAGASSIKKDRLYARDRAIEWLDFRRRLNRNDKDPMELCFQASGNKDQCETRAVDAAGEVTLSVGSVPPGAAVWVNGTERGVTPLTVAVPAGTVKLVLKHASGQSRSESVEVGGSKPATFIWRSAEDTWQALE